MNPLNSSTHDKAFAINLHPAQYSTFAEIGAGQEVARGFFHVGGAAATVARSISAYVMALSTATYGPAARYVSRQRLQAMRLRSGLGLRSTRAVRKVFTAGAPLLFQDL
jgi:hypothetical protein